MEHRTIEKIAKVAQVSCIDGRVYDPPGWIVRRRRLEQWAKLLEEHDEPVRLFSEMEYLPKKQQLALRQTDSPLEVAFADSELRGAGLDGAGVEQAVNFFHLSLGEAHRLLCDCRYPEARRRGAATPAVVAGRVRALAAKRTFPELLEMARGVIARWR
jgi:hypothetical protein